MDSDTLARIAYLSLLLTAVGGWALVEFRGRLGFALRTALAWAMIFVGVMAGYGIWRDIDQDLRPRATVTEAGEIRVPRAEDGHYYLSLQINGQTIDFLADTGATNLVLTEDDARAIGMNPDTLVYLGEARTANGSVRTAHVTLDEVQLGPYSDLDVSAWVNRGEMDISLLGMDYLGNFRIEIDRNQMVLRR